MKTEQVLTKFESNVPIKYKNGNYGYSKINRTVYTDGEKYFALAYRAYRTIWINEKEFMEVEKIMDTWYVK